MLSWMTYLRSHVTGFQLPCQRLDSWRQQVSHRVVELGQINPNPGSQEDDVAH